ncbi:MAG TPA: site-2 protease family protein [Solirubrobacterales bacterium]
MSWFWVFVGLCFLIVLHEAGHFVAAKATGMRVERFFLFFGPTIWSFKRGETEYGVKAIPLGGYVKITGMNPEEEIPPEVADRAYYRQPVWKRIVVIGAGPGVNIALALVIFFVIALTNATARTETVQEVLKGTPGAKVLKPGDRIVAVDGHRYPGLDSEARIERFREEIGSHHCAGGAKRNGCVATTPVELSVLRNGQLTNVSVRPRYDALAGQPVVGFSFGERPVSLGVGEAIDRATGFAWRLTHETATRIAKIFNSKERKEIHGIVGVSDVGHEVVGLGLTEALTFLAVISLSLGIINLFPFLPLDGGHIFWSIIEKLRGQRVSLKTMEMASVVGFALVALLFVIGLSNDIGTLTGEGFKVK